MHGRHRERHRRLDPDLLDEIAIDLSRLPGRDPAAGEVPDLPPNAGLPKKARKKARNTVFDDKGAPSAAHR